MYDSEGNLTWEADLDIYGRVRNFAGRSLNSCPFRYAGQYFDEEINLGYNRFRYIDYDIGSYISQDPIRLAGNNPTLYGYVKDVNNWIDVTGLNATDFQGKGDYPGIDDWNSTILKKGTVVYGGIPGQSQFYLSEDSFKSAGGSKQKLWESAQVKPHPIYGYRNQVQAYEVLDDITVETSITRTNPQYGSGGARQYYIDDYETKLKPVGKPIDLH